MNKRPRIYFDHSATTPVDRRAVEAMIPYLTEKCGNPSSIHSFGQEARAAVDRARRQVAALISAQPGEVIFLSGGTEANNLALRGIAEMPAIAGAERRHLITSAIEHSAVGGVCDFLETRGWEVTRLPVYEDGIVRADDVRAALRPETVLISVMLANNEVGTIQPVAELGELVRAARSAGRRHLYLHTDAVQAAGRMLIDVETLGCDLLSLSAHKLYAPKGVGALYVRRGVRLATQNIGGHQERERRAGTEAVPNLVAFGLAAQLAREELDFRVARMGALRDRFEAVIAARIPDVVFNGHRTKRLPHLANISFRHIEGEGLLINLDLQGVAVSTGSACSSGSIKPSPVLRALGRDDELARGSIRFSFGKDTTDEEVDAVLDILQRAVENLRRLSPLAATRQIENQIGGVSLQPN
ncbi:MAG TPA: cysteine desulfurase family protein [Pyrinomonadaceae bacterium]|nr:cysteine desulfurase family protein [Pyrinomonadaceae bacterium]